MSFNVSWVYKAIDKYTPVAKKIRAASDKLEGAVRRVGATATRVQGRVNRLSTSLRSSGGAIENLQSKMMAFAAIAATAFVISFPVQQAMKFEDALADIQKVVTFKEPTGLAQMADEILDLSKRIPVTAVDIAGIVAEGGKFGLAEDKLIGFAKTVSMIAVAFDMLPDQVAAPMARIVGNLDIPIDRMLDFADIINSVADSTKVLESEIIRSLENKGAAAGRAMGLAAQDTLALAAAFRVSGVRAERVGSIMGSMARRLQDVSVVGKILGREFMDKFTEKPKETLIRLLRVINKMPKGANKMGALIEIFGEYSTQVELLADAMDKDLLPLLEIANRTMGTSGSVARVYALRIETASAKMKMMTNRISAVSTLLGGALLPSLKPVVDFMGLFADGMDGLIRMTGPLVPALFSAAFAILAVAAATKLWAIAMAVFSLAATPISLIIVALAGVGTIIAWLSDKFGGFLNLIKHLGNTLIRLLLLPVLLVAKAFDALFDTNIEGRVKDLAKAITFDINAGIMATNNDSRAQIDVNLNAPPGVVSSIESKTEGPSRLNVGQNVVPEGAG